MLLSTKAVYFVLHDGLRRYFSEPLQGRRSSLQGLGAGRGDNSTSLRSDMGAMPGNAWALALTCRDVIASASWISVGVSSSDLVTPLS